MTLTPNPRALRALLWPALLSLSLSACGVGVGVGEALTQKTFTFKGKLPADFSLRAQAHYSVANDCTAGRSKAKTFKTEFQSTPQQYNFEIPVTYRHGLCEMQLARVGLFIEGRYGEQDWQNTYDNGELRIVDALPEGALEFKADGYLTKQAQCTWLFQQSTAKSHLGEISKLLKCKSAGAYLAVDTLPGKIVQLDFTVSDEERPYLRDTWVKFPEGWKPCLPKEGWPNCQVPPVFKTFKMNGRECTVYPNCTE
ncbi:hypothetical protein [Pseudomonas sp. 5P_3.1_Bac2]|uniref:hypothetical protein n=1 Tax=Pseudomonas sp. 5P_3.1_Bac2 TaxID=2971617 RepID=UPI0021C5E91A|nr:hypothetical protein [Pseudomonas sp. 5P_3.1_Bac2]MCU1718975.1 hypothetical protein [Pseudomonas sp. 5P_3.1_Bac2]